MSIIRYVTTKFAALLLIFSLTAGAAQASGVRVDWSFLDADQGGNNTISGYAILDPFCSLFLSCAEAATSVVLTSSPLGPDGFDFVQSDTVLYNEFVLQDGELQSADFWAYGDGDGFQLQLSFGSVFTFCTGLDEGGLFPTEYATDGCTTGPFAGDNSSLSFSEASVVPIPAAVWLFGSALAGLGWIRRKQAA